MNHELLTVKEVAALLRVSPMTCYRLLKSKQLHGLRVGRSYRVRSSDLAEFIERAEVGS